MPFKFVLGMTCLLCSSLYAQTIRPLQINETIPVVQYTYAFNDMVGAALLPDNSGRLTILDFWATWCSSCIKTFPKMETLQDEFKNRLQVVLVNTKNSGDDTVKVNRFLRKWQERTGKRLHLRSVVNDSILDAMFPHNLVPHYVWINSAGKVIATTSAEQVTAANIRAVLDGVEVAFPMKRDQDRDKPLFTNADLPTKRLLSYSILLKGRFDGLGTGNRMHKTGDTLHGWGITNTSLIEIYFSILSRAYPGFTRNKIRLEVKNPAQLEMPHHEESLNHWYRQNTYTLEVILPPDAHNKLYNTMFEELNRSSGYIGKMEQRKIPCLVLCVQAKHKPPYTKGGATAIHLFNGNNIYIKNAPIRHLITRLNNCEAISLPVLNETGYTGNIDIDFPDGFKDIESIRRRLQYSGLDLREAERTIEVFVIKDK